MEVELSEIEVESSKLSAYPQRFNELVAMPEMVGMHVGSNQIGVAPKCELWDMSFDQCPTKVQTIGGTIGTQGKRTEKLLWNRPQDRQCMPSRKAESTRVEMWEVKGLPHSIRMEVSIELCGAALVAALTIPFVRPVLIES
ncbi:hypothetical protein Tco_0149174 [Tanacetum coccineum]